MAYTCEYENCSAQVHLKEGQSKVGALYCVPHLEYIRNHGLCLGCRNPKERPEVKLCLACFQGLNSRKRQLAIDAGLCTNFWKCQKPAVRRGQMCSSCYEEYLAKKYPVVPVVAPVGAVSPQATVLKPVLTSAPEASLVEASPVATVAVSEKN